MPFLLFQKKYFTAGGATDRGLCRGDNQDSWCCVPESGLFAVSDGMGGGDGGALASAIVIKHLQRAARTPLKNLAAVSTLVYEANGEILRFAAANNLRGMGATALGLLLSPFHPGKAMVFHAGDSRCYRLRKRELRLLTDDHNVASAMGIPEEKLAFHLRGVLTNAVGCGPRFFLETQFTDVKDMDVFLLCSDGIYRQIPEEEMRSILSSAPSAEKAARSLVDASLNHGGDDNATALVVKFGKLPGITPEIREEEASAPEKAPWDGENDDDATPPTE